MKPRCTVIGHVAETIWLNRYSDANFIVMFDQYSAHFDESGTHMQDRVVTVSGFVSDMNKWKRFEKEWPEILTEAGLPPGTIFHMKPFAHSRKEFAIFSGKPEVKAAVFSRLIQCTRRNVNKAFSCTIVLRDWKRLNTLYELEEAWGHPYSFCGLHCMEMVQTWANKNKIRHPIEYFFEDGANYRGELRTLAERDYKITPFFMPKSRVIQFQCCDLLAWKNHKIIEQSLAWGRTGGADALDSLVRSAREINAIPHSYGVHHYETLEKVCRLHIPKRERRRAAAR